MKKMDSVKKSHSSINKFLFLDVDGVLNSDTWYHEEWDKAYDMIDFGDVRDCEYCDDSITLIEE